MLKKLATLSMLGLFVTVISACNTVEGMEEDAEETGDNIADTTEDIMN